MRMWYAVYTRPGWERRVSDVLTRKGVETYCPLNRVRADRNERRRSDVEPLFPSYVFANVSEDQHVILKQTNGVINLVYWRGSPAVFSDGEIKAVGIFLREHPRVLLEKASVSLPVAQTADGFLINTEKSGSGWPACVPTVILPSLGYTLVAEAAATIKVVDLAYSRKRAWDFPVQVQT
ncbi:MAG: UpxY family transcription antiterminator [Chitinophagaceae bacterium]